MFIGKRMDKFPVSLCLTTRRRLLLACGVLFALMTSAVAQPADEPADEPAQWRVSGFGTLGFVYHDEDNFRFRRSIEQPDGVKNGTLGTSVDSSAGLQIDGQLDHDWSLMAQGVSRQRADGDWDPSLTWGFVKYAPNDAFVLRLGRLGMDLYLDGDSRHVGYTFTTVRPVPLIYGLIAFDTYDGAELSVRHDLGSGQSWLKVYGGRTRGDSALLNYYKPPRATTLGTTYEWSTHELMLSATLAQIQGREDDAFSSLASSLRSVGSTYGIAQASERADDIRGTSRIRFGGVAASWERRPYSLKGVVAWLDYQAFPDYHGWMSDYTAAYRIGKWKPFVSYSRSIIKAVDRPLALPPVTALAPLATRYQQVVGRLRDDEYTFGLGVRYELARNTALKFQLDHIKAKRSLMQLDDDGQQTRDSRANVFTVTLDYVF